MVRACPPARSGPAHCPQRRSTAKYRQAPGAHRRTARAGKPWHRQIWNAAPTRGSAVSARDASGHRPLCTGDLAVVQTTAGGSPSSGSTATGARVGDDRARRRRTRPRKHGRPCITSVAATTGSAGRWRRAAGRRRATSPIVVQPDGVGSGGVERERLPDRGPGGDDDHLAGVQAVGERVQVGEPGRHAGQRAAAAADRLDLVERARHDLRQRLRSPRWSGGR